jgi:DNA-binding PadR family transcriptional regulator
MTRDKLTALRLLSAFPEGLYGSDFVRLTKGHLGRGTIYTLLDELACAGYVREIAEPPTPDLQMERYRHVITDAGTLSLKYARKE